MFRRGRWRIARNSSAERGRFFPPRLHVKLRGSFFSFAPDGGGGETCNIATCNDWPGKFRNIQPRESKSKNERGREREKERSHAEFLSRLCVNQSRDTCCKFDQRRQFRFNFITVHSFRFESFAALGYIRLIVLKHPRLTVTPAHR